MSHLLPTTLASLFTPKAGGSPNADEIHSLYMITLYVAFVIFVVVEGALAYALFRFRTRKGAVAAQIHGNTRLEVSWTLGASRCSCRALRVHLREALLDHQPAELEPAADGSSGTAASSTRPPKTASPPSGKSLEINVVGRQYVWQFVYPGGAPTSSPRRTPTRKWSSPPKPRSIDATSVDVVHGWWVPQLGGKVQVVPGYHNYTWFKIPAAQGVYHGQCANLCGRGHARMIATVRAVPPAQFEAWLAERRRLIAEANADAAARRSSPRQGSETVEHP